MIMKRILNTIILLYHKLIAYLKMNLNQLYFIYYIQIFERLIYFLFSRLQFTTSCFELQQTKHNREDKHLNLYFFFSLKKHI